MSNFWLDLETFPNPPHPKKRMIYINTEMWRRVGRTDRVTDTSPRITVVVSSSYKTGYHVAVHTIRSSNPSSALPAYPLTQTLALLCCNSDTTSGGTLELQQNCSPHSASETFTLRTMWRIGTGFPHWKGSVYGATNDSANTLKDDPLLCVKRLKSISPGSMWLNQVTGSIETH